MKKEIEVVTYHTNIHFTGTFLLYRETSNYMFTNLTILTNNVSAIMT